MTNLKKSVKVSMETLLVFSAAIVTIVSTLPVVDKGVFVITGVGTCGGGAGYCILGPDCSVDKEFTSDVTGHCDGLKKAFTPRAYFVCCRLVANDSMATITIPTTTTPTFLLPNHTHPASSEELPESTESPEEVSMETTERATPPVIQTTPTPTPPNPTPTCHTPFSPSHNSSSSNPCWTAAIIHTPTTPHSSPHSPQPHPHTDPGTILCSGALITQNAVLTSATCASRLLTSGNRNFSHYRVVLGARRLRHPSQGWMEGVEYREVGGVKVKEGWGLSPGGGVPRGVNDLAIIYLKEEEGAAARREKPYCTICLAPPTTTTTPPESCIVTGYSHPTAPATSSSSTSSYSTLHSAPQTLLPLSAPTCLDSLSSSSHSHSSTTNLPHPQSNLLLCGAGEEGAEACFSPRDSGSPLACFQGDSVFLYGLFSSGFHCGSLRNPVVYVGVGQGGGVSGGGYRGWIEENLVGVSF